MAHSNKKYHYTGKTLTKNHQKTNISSQTCPTDQAISKRNALASYLYLRLFNEVLMSANKSLAGETPEKADDLNLTLDIVDGYGIKLV